MPFELSDESILLIFKQFGYEDFETTQNFQRTCSSVRKVAISHNEHKMYAAVVRVEQLDRTPTDGVKIGFKIINLAGSDCSYLDWESPLYINETFEPRPIDRWDGDDRIYLYTKSVDQIKDFQQHALRILRRILSKVRYIRQFCLFKLNLNDEFVESISDMFHENKLTVLKLNIVDCQFSENETSLYRFLSILKPEYTHIINTFEPDFYLLNHLDETNETTQHGSVEPNGDQHVHPIYMMTSEVIFHNRKNGHFNGWNKFPVVDDNLIDHWIKKSPDIRLYIGGTVSVTFAALWKRFELSDEQSAFIESVENRYDPENRENYIEPVTWRFNNISSSENTLKDLIIDINIEKPCLGTFKQILLAQRNRTYRWNYTIRKHYTFYRVQNDRRELSFKINRPNHDMTTEEYQTEVDRAFEKLDQEEFWTAEQVFMLKNLTEMVPPEKCSHLMPEIEERISNMMEGWHRAQFLFHEDD